jgi:hypothetical protein
VSAPTKTAFALTRTAVAEIRSADHVVEHERADRHNLASAINNPISVAHVGEEQVRLPHHWWPPPGLAYCALVGLGNTQLHPDSQIPGQSIALVRGLRIEDPYRLSVIPQLIPVSSGETHATNVAGPGWADRSHMPPRNKIEFLARRFRKGASGTFHDQGLEGASHHAVIPNVNMVDHLRVVWPRLSIDEKKLFDVASFGAFKDAVSIPGRVETTPVRYCFLDYQLLAIRPGLAPGWLAAHCAGGATTWC